MWGTAGTSPSARPPTSSRIGYGTRISRETVTMTAPTTSSRSRSSAAITCRGSRRPSLLDPAPGHRQRIQDAAQVFFRHDLLLERDVHEGAPLGEGPLDERGGFRVSNCGRECCHAERWPTRPHHPTARFDDGE